MSHKQEQAIYQVQYIGKGYVESGNEKRIIHIIDRINELEVEIKILQYDVARVDDFLSTLNDYDCDLLWLKYINGYTILKLASEKDKKEKDIKKEIKLILKKFC